MGNWAKRDNGDMELRLFRRDADSTIPYIVHVRVWADQGLPIQDVLDTIETALASERWRKSGV